MNKLLTYLLLFAVLFQYHRNLILIISFKINQEYIAKVLCINRDKPELQCNGHCQLTKSLREQGEKEQQVPQRLQEEITLYISGEICLLHCIFSPQAQKLTSLLQQMKSKLLLFDIFRPPKSILPT